MSFYSIEPLLNMSQFEILFCIQCIFEDALGDMKLQMDYMQHKLCVL